MRRIWAFVLLITLPSAAAPPAATRQALLSDIADMQTFIPAEARDAVDNKYRPIFEQLHREALESPDLAGVAARFDRNKGDYFKELYAAHDREFNGNPGLFEEYVRKRLDLAVTLRKLAERKDIFKPDQLSRIEAYRAQLHQLSVSESRLDLITLCVGSYMKRSGLVLNKSWFQPAQRAPETGLKPPPSPAAVDAPPQVSALSRFIAQVTGAASGYAQTVAGAISSISALHWNLDPRLTAGLVQAESSFHANSGSWAGCMGLGQLSKGIASAYGVKNPFDVQDNLIGTTGYLSTLLAQFSTHDERAYLKGLYATGAARVSRGESADAVFGQLWPKIPDGVKDAVAAYNAGGGAIERYGHWYKLPLPAIPAAKKNAPSSEVLLALKGRADAAGRPLADHCANRPDQDNSYCQTMAYVPRVLKNYFTVYVQTTPASSSAPPSRK